MKPSLSDFPFLSHFPHPTFLVSLPHLRVLDANPAARQLFSPSSTDSNLLNSNLRDFFQLDHKSTLTQWIHAELEDPGPPSPYRTKLHAPAPTPTWFDLECHPCPDHPDHVILTAHNTTELVETRRELIRLKQLLDPIIDHADPTPPTHIQRRGLFESEYGKFRSIAEHIQEVFWISDPEKKQVTYISPAFESVWGLPRQSLYDDPLIWAKSIITEHWERVFKAAHHQDRGDYHQVYQIERPDGSRRWISDRAFPVQDPSGQVVQIVGIARDITAQKHFELALEERIKELRCLYKVSSLLATADSHEIFHAVADELPHGMAHESICVAKLTIDDHTYPSAHYAPPLSSLEVPILVANRQVGLLQVGYREPRPDLGQDLGPFMPEEEEMLIAISTHIARFLASRDLTRQLNRSDRLNAIGQLTGGVAHDFNNLLTVILGNSELLRSHLQDDFLTEVLEDIIQASRTGRDLTQRLLAIARRQPLSPRPTPIAPLLNDLLRLLKRTLGEHITLSLHLATDLPNALIDAAQLETALLNLCLNARDAMPHGGELTISADTTHLRLEDLHFDEDVDPGTYLRLTISDTGSGMSPQVANKAFEPFFTTKAIGKGSGLGLSMVYGFVRQSNGLIRLDSTPDVGTQLHLLLPIPPESTSHSPQSPSPSPTTTPTTTHISHPAPDPRTILVVEDNEMVRRNVLRILRQEGFSVLEASNGARALDILNTHPVDLLFTDLVMPGGLDGHALANQAHTLLPDLPVLFTSGFNALKDHAAIPPDELIQKPYTNQELLHRIRQALSLPSPTES